MVIVEARSGPNQGFVRPPFTGLRVVVMSNVGSDDSKEASNRAPAAPTPAHPPSASTLEHPPFCDYARGVMAVRIAFALPSPPTLPEEQYVVHDTVA